MSAESMALLQKAKTKVLPHLVDDDRQELERLIATLERSTPDSEAGPQSALMQEVRKHAYLL
jgi:hypothetical protein